MDFNKHLRFLYLGNKQIQTIEFNIQKMPSNQNTIKYIYNLPYLNRLELCRILNRNNKWEELASVWMTYDSEEICDLRNEPNPTDELLTMWGHHNHTILELFILLARMEHYEAMMPLKTFVDEKYHALILQREEVIGKPLDNAQLCAENSETGNNHLSRAQKLIRRIEEMTINSGKEQTEKKISNLPVQQNENYLTSLLVSMPNIFSTLPRIPYDQLTTATDNWANENVLGKGGFGIVYKGIWKNTDVAIKKIVPKNANYDEGYVLQLEQSLREIRILNSLPHQNILALYAYCIENVQAPCLVYQCMTNGSVEDRLRLKNESAPLDWVQRREIAKGTARGLQYLHTIRKKPLIHGDIKSANILLDTNFEPKIGDFGLASEGSSGDSVKVSKIQGTRPYLPAEYIVGKNLSTKIDTYSYGIVLLELATGLSAYDKTRPTKKLLKDYVDSFDDINLDDLKDKLAGKTYDEVFKYLMALGKWCSNTLAENRPEMFQVFEKFV